MRSNSLSSPQEQFCYTASSLEDELAAATHRVVIIVNRLRVLVSLGNSASVCEETEILELSVERNALVVECERILQQLGEHRTQHGCLRRRGTARNPHVGTRDPQPRLPRRSTPVGSVEAAAI